MKLTKTKLRNLIREEIQKLNEAVKYDIVAALRDIKEYNRKNISFDQMIESIVKN